MLVIDMQRKVCFQERGKEEERKNHPIMITIFDFLYDVFETEEKAEF